MENRIAISARYANSVNYQKMAANLVAIVFLASGMALAMYLGVFP
jgi:hypothetical protein